MTARVTDQGQGICPIHGCYTTVFARGAATVTINGLPAAIVTSMGISSCGHPTVAIRGSTDVNIENQGAHRLADQGANGGPYHVTTDSPDTKVNGK